MKLLKCLLVCAWLGVMMGGCGKADNAPKVDAAPFNAAVEEYCRARGLKINRFIETALLDRLEEIEDVEDLRRLRTEPTRPFKDVLRDLKRDGLL